MTKVWIWICKFNKEKKGIFSIEKFLTARRLMYWQVYLHKTSLVAEQMIINVLKRAKILAQQSVELNVTSSFEFFLKENIRLSISLLVAKNQMCLREI